MGRYCDVCSLAVHENERERHQLMMGHAPWPDDDEQHCEFCGVWIEDVLFEEHVKEHVASGEVELVYPLGQGSPVYVKVGNAGVRVKATHR